MNRRNQFMNYGLDLTDYGPEPFVVNIGRAARQNCNYRAALWTGKHLQVTLMSIPCGGDVGLEIHSELDQFIYVEDGFGIVKMGGSMEKLNYQKDVGDGFSIFVPAGTWHNIINKGNKPLKLFSVYAPAHHEHGVIRATKEDAAPEDYTAPERHGESMEYENTEYIVE